MWLDTRAIRAYFTFKRFNSIPIQRKDTVILKSSGRRSRQKDDKRTQGLFGPPLFQARASAQVDEPGALEGFLQRLIVAASAERVPGLFADGEKPLSLDLEDIYVPPTVSVVRREGSSSSIDTPEGEGQDPRPESLSERDQRITIDEALRRWRHVMVVGPLGSGKSALLRYLALTFAQGLQMERLGLTEDHLPVLISSAQAERACLTEEVTPGRLCSLCGWQEDAQIGEALFERYLNDGRIVLLVDCPDRPVPSEDQVRVLGWVGLWTLAYPGIRCVAAVDSQARELVFPPSSFSECRLEPTRPADVERMSGRWFSAVEGTLRPGERVERVAQRRSSGLMGAIRRSASRLATQPGYLRRIAFVHLHRSDLSGVTLELIRDYTDAVLATHKPAQWMTPGERLLPAQRVALLEVEGVEGPEAFEAQVADALVELETPEGLTGEGWLQGMSASGLIEESSGGGWKFTDLLCRDYLAARELCRIAALDFPSQKRNSAGPSSDQGSSALAEFQDRNSQVPDLSDAAGLIDHLQKKGCLYLVVWCAGLSPDFSPFLRVLLAQEETVFRESLQTAARCLAWGRVDGRPFREEVSSALIALCQEGEFDLLRKWAFDRLCDLDAEQVSPGFIDRFGSPEPGEREKVCEALGRIGGSAAVAALSHRAAHDPAPGVRAAACRALGQIGDAEAIEPLFRLALESEDTQVRAAACRALGQLGSEWVYRRMMEALADRRSTVRAGAALTLGHIGDERATLRLLEAIADEDSSVRLWVIQALGMLRSGEALEHLVSALRDEDWAVRREACIALGLIGSRTAIKPLAAALKDGYSSVRRAACEALGRVGTEAPVSALIKSLSDGDWAVRREACRALSRIRPDAAVAPLLRALRDRDAFVRAASVEILGWIDKGKAGDVLARVVCDDEYSSVRRAACEALGRMVGDRYTSILRTALKDPSSSVRRSALRAICLRGPTDLRELLTQAVQDADEEVREEGCEGLGAVNEAWAIDVLSGALSDASGQVRSKACEALGRSGGTECIPMLCRLLKDADATVRDAAYEALWRVCQRTGRTVYLKEVE